MESCDNNFCINDCCNDNCCNEDWCNDDWCCDTICCDERCALASIIQSVAIIPEFQKDSLHDTKLLKMFDIIPNEDYNIFVKTISNFII